MARQRSEKRDKAYELWKGSNGKMPLTDIAAALNVSDNQVRKWKHQDRWDDINNTVTLPNEKKSNVTKKNATSFKPGNRASVGHGAPKGNKNALGNDGGAPKGNNNATKHGFFKLVFPDDEETHAILNEIQAMSPIEILWDQIQIQYLAIARAQRIMWVRDQEDRTEVLKRERRGKNPEKEWELQHAWDKQATYLTAQSRAMQTLERLIARYEELLLKELATEEQQLRVEKLKAEVARLKNPEGEEPEDDGFLEALAGTVKEVWSDEDQA